MEIVNAVLLAQGRRAAGIWSQLGLRASDLVPLANRPLLCHNLEALADAGVRRVAVMVDPRTAPEIRAAVGDGRAWGLDVRYLESPGSFDALGQLRAAESVVAGEPFIAQRGDVLVRDRIRPLGGRFAAAGLDALALELGEMRGPARDVSLAPVSALPTAQDVVGMCFLRPQVLAGLSRTRGRSELGDLVASLHDRGGRVGRHRVVGCLPCRGDRMSLLDANREVLQSLPTCHDGAEIVDSEIQGPVHIAPGARVRRSLVRGPAIIGAGAKLSHAYVGPYTSIGSGVAVEAAEVEHSIVMPDAEIRFLDARLESSVVGRGARVVRELRVPHALQMLIADGAEVTLA